MYWQRRQEVNANNLANVNTIYARLRAARRAFSRYLDALDQEEVPA